MHDAWLSPEELDTWQAFLAASQLMEAAIDADLRKSSGITHAEYEILIRLAERPGGRMRMGELARAVITAKSALTYKIASLEKKGYVLRVRCPHDARGLEAQITLEGRSALEDAAPGHVLAVRRFLIDLLRPEELKHLGALSHLLLQAHDYSPTPCAEDSPPPQHQDQQCSQVDIHSANGD